MADSSRRCTRPPWVDLLPTNAHSAIVCGQTGCGKTVFVLDLLDGPYRERFRHIVILCQARQYGLLGVGDKTLTQDQVDLLKEDEVEKLYARYEARLGATMLKTLVRAALQLYTGVACRFLPIPPANQLVLYSDLNADPFIGHAQ